MTLINIYGAVNHEHPAVRDFEAAEIAFNNSVRALITKHNLAPVEIRILAGYSYPQAVFAEMILRTATAMKKAEGKI